VPSQPQVAVDAVLQRLYVHLDELVCLRLPYEVSRDVRQGLAAPQPERLGEVLRGEPPLAVARGRLPRVKQGEVEP
jgi:hypothetical protein